VDPPHRRHQLDRAFGRELPVDAPTLDAEDLALLDALEPIPLGA
jgi:hypothetical protein